MTDAEARAVATSAPITDTVFAPWAVRENDVARLCLLLRWALGRPRFDDPIPNTPDRRVS